MLHFSRDIAILLLYVDDIVLIASNELRLKEIISNLNIEFAIKDLGSLYYFLGLEITPFLGGIFLSQKKYARFWFAHPC